jgi:hypothetical protein
LKYEDLKDGRFQDFLGFDLTREDWMVARERWRQGHERRTG